MQRLLGKIKIAQQSDQRCEIRRESDAYTHPGLREHHLDVAQADLTLSIHCRSDSPIAMYASKSLGRVLLNKRASSDGASSAM